MNAPSRTSLFLMANLGSEISRIISFQEKGAIEHAAKAEARAEKIIRDLENLSEMKSREAEMALLARVVKNLRKPSADLIISPDVIRSYFMPFASRLASHMMASS